MLGSSKPFISNAKQANHTSKHGTTKIRRKPFIIYRKYRKINFTRHEARNTIPTSTSTTTATKRTNQKTQKDQSSLLLQPIDPQRPRKTKKRNHKKQNNKLDSSKYKNKKNQKNERDPLFFLFVVPPSSRKLLPFCRGPRRRVAIDRGLRSGQEAHAIIGAFFFLFVCFFGAFFVLFFKSTTLFYVFLEYHFCCF